MFRLFVIFLFSFNYIILRSLSCIKGKKYRFLFNTTFASVQKTIFLLMFAFFLLKEQFCTECLCFDNQKQLDWLDMLIKRFTSFP